MKIVDERERHRFVTTVEGREAQLVYRTEADRLVLEGTEVPDAASGKGVGGALVRAAVDRAEASGETLIPECPFTDSWLRKHDDEAARVKIAWSEAS